MKKLSIFAIVAIFFGLFTLSSCNKESATTDESIEAAISADQASDDAVSLADDEATTTKSTLDNNCFSVERNIDLENKIGTVIITFNGTTCADSVYRAGTIKITWDLGWRTDPEGKGLTVTFENYVRGNKIFNGTITHSLSLDTSSLDSGLIVPVMHATYQNFTVTFPDSTQFEITGTRTIRHEGFFTITKDDDELVINSSLQGTSRDGNSFTIVDADVTSKFACGFRFPVAGTKTISFKDGKTYVINYGDGTCDKVYTITVDGKTETRVWSADSEKR